MPAAMPRRAPRLKSSTSRIRRTSVHSSSVREVGYDPVTRSLEIQFTGGGLYRYDEVPPMLHEGLLIAASPGRFVNERIRGRFRCHRIV